MDKLPAQLRNVFFSLIIVMLTSGLLGHLIADVVSPAPFCTPCLPQATETQMASLVPDGSQTHLFHAGFIMIETSVLTLILGLLFTPISNLPQELIQVVPRPNRPPILVANRI